MYYHKLYDDADTNIVAYFGIGLFCMLLCAIIYCAGYVMLSFCTGFLCFMLLFINSMNIVKIELIFIDKKPVINVYKTGTILFLSTYSTEYKDFKKAYVKKIVSKNNSTTDYYLMLKFADEKTVAAFDTTDFQYEKLKQFCNKINRSVCNKENCVINSETNMLKKARIVVALSAILMIVFPFMAYRGDKKHNFWDGMEMALYSYLIAVSIIVLLGIFSLILEHLKK